MSDSSISLVMNRLLLSSYSSYAKRTIRSLIATRFSKWSRSKSYILRTCYARCDSYKRSLNVISIYINKLLFLFVPYHSDPGGYSLKTLSDTGASLGEGGNV